MQSLWGYTYTHTYILPNQIKVKWKFRNLQYDSTGVFENINCWRRYRDWKSVATCDFLRNQKYPWTKRWGNNPPLVQLIHSYLSVWKSEKQIFCGMLAGEIFAGSEAIALAAVMFLISIWQLSIDTARIRAAASGNISFKLFCTSSKYPFLCFEMINWNI